MNVQFSRTYTTKMMSPIQQNLFQTGETWPMAQEVKGTWRPGWEVLCKDAAKGENGKKPVRVGLELLNGDEPSRSQKDLRLPFILSVSHWCHCSIWSAVIVWLIFGWLRCQNWNDCLDFQPAIQIHFPQENNPNLYVPHHMYLSSHKQHLLPSLSAFSFSTFFQIIKSQ